MGKVKTGVYLITCKPTGRKYVGSAAISFAKRWAQHRHDLRGGQHRSAHMQRSWVKYGEEAFEFAVLEACAPAQAVACEQRWIDKLKPEFNTAPIAGSSLGQRRSERSCKLNGQLAKQRNLSKADKGVGHLTELVRTPEFRAAASARMKARQGSGACDDANRRGGITRARRHKIGGEMLTLAEAAAKYGRTVKALSRRIERGARGDDIVAPPYHTRRK